MQKIFADVVVFGYGKLISQLLMGLPRRELSIICITDQKALLPKLESESNVKFFSRREIVNFKLNSSVSIFAWKDNKHLYENYGLLKTWLESDLFECTKSFFLSSASVYKDSKILITESTSNLDRDIQSNAKYRLEEVLSEIMLSKSGRNINLRISNVYGRELSYGFIGSLIQNVKNGKKVIIFKGAEIVRDYISIDDVIFAITNLISKDITVKNINVSSGIGTSVNQVISIFNGLGYMLNPKVEELVNEQFKFSVVLDCTLLSSLISWAPKPLSLEIERILQGNTVS
jgi:nucleoside-diphosphate-sugar epimerase